ncbi:unnamed protein product [Fraxinus pennsylvanica]|uniref:Uncharacterized protein n=1 Tax=Fraxinus pennsylvanica TaxID=56036 RepID=A0AAD1ZLR6_9LAMI|nr:unnamed protein product [Fraxinus pennsylvanica]
MLHLVSRDLLLRKHEVRSNVIMVPTKFTFNTVGDSCKGIQSNNGSVLYYLLGYGYTTRFVDVDGKQPCVPYRPDTFPCYTYDSTYAGNCPTVSSIRASTIRSMMGLKCVGFSNAFNSRKSNKSM